jgi:amino acid transporter
MTEPVDESMLRAEDERLLKRLGYTQELDRRMSGFSNLALSMSVICILAGGVTSFPLGFCSVGGAAIGLGWPLACLFALTVAATMGQVASAFPTAGGLYHWAAILGGRGCGWVTAWLNLAGLITVLAAINLGTYEFFTRALGPTFGFSTGALSPASQAIVQTAAVAAITFSQAVFNHAGIRLTTRLTDFSGYWILFVSLALTVALLAAAPALEPGRLVTFHNFSGSPTEETAVWPRTDHVGWLFLLGLLLPAYTLTGFDASAHTAEETLGASANVPRGIVRSVLVSGVFGWLMLSALVLAAPSLEEAAREGDGAFVWIVSSILPEVWTVSLFAGIAIAQYLCGLATVTSASRMAYAFARDGGLPCSALLRRVSPGHRTPAPAIWLVAGSAVLFTVYSPVYSTISAVCAIFLYLSYVLPAGLGWYAHGRTWTRMGPWHLGRWYRPLALACVAGCGLLLFIGMQPPNQLNGLTLAVTLILLAILWRRHARHRFRGPPHVSTAEGVGQAFQPDEPTGSGWKA